MKTDVAGTYVVIIKNGSKRLQNIVNGHLYNFLFLRLADKIENKDIDKVSSNLTLQMGKQKIILFENDIFCNLKFSSIIYGLLCPCFLDSMLRHLKFCHLEFTL